MTDGRTTHPLVADLARERLIAVIRAGREVEIDGVADLLVDGGINWIEITLTTPGALDAIGALQGRRARGLNVGAGTVLTSDLAAAALRVGVDFLVSPTVEPDVVASAHEAGKAAFVGGLTPTEILAAWRAGADVVKVFPGRVATPGYFADLKGPLPHIPLMPTGNVDVETAPAYLESGAIAVGVGKALVNPSHLATGDLDAVRADIRLWRRLVDEVAAPA
jgi:2-dehydro-3-deoxyphosphogluconate aldolase / (4S)-4-hydroxy-2-oxoglutarate aldolase